MLEFIVDIFAPLFDAFDLEKGWHVFFVAVLVFVIVAAIAWFLSAH